MTITINDARKLGKRTSAKGIVILEFTGTSYNFVSYGDSKTNCRRLGVWIEELGENMEAGLITPPWDSP